MKLKLKRKPLKKLQLKRKPVARPRGLGKNIA